MSLIFATYLAPTLYKTYQAIVEHVEQYVGMPCVLLCGETLDDFAAGYVDAGFMCGLAYTTLLQQHDGVVQLSAAPVLEGERYQRCPWYFSDVIVRRDSYRYSFSDLRGCRWAYNEQQSHSGYNIVYSTLLKRGESMQYFGQTLETGSHAQSLYSVLDGHADAAAIDSHILDVILNNHPGIASRLRIVDSLGPSTIPPLVVASRLDASLRYRIQEAVLNVHRDPHFSKLLHEGQIERFVPVTDAQYDDIRAVDKRVWEHRLWSSRLSVQPSCRAPFIKPDGAITPDSAITPDGIITPWQKRTAMLT